MSSEFGINDISAPLLNITDFNNEHSSGLSTDFSDLKCTFQFLRKKSRKKSIRKGGNECESHSFIFVLNSFLPLFLYG